MKCLVKSPFIVAIALLALLSACSRGKQMRARMQYVAACNKADNRFRVAPDTKNILRLTIGA